MKKLPEGKYFVGDLVYVLDEDNGYVWGDVVEKTNVFGLTRGVKKDGGYFTYHGVRFFTSSTMYGDGVYSDNYDREYPVDSGMIGCFPLEALGPNPIISNGHIVNFNRAFTCKTIKRDGMIEIGHIQIETDD